MGDWLNNPKVMDELSKHYKSAAPREWWIDDVTQRVCAPWNHETLGVQTMSWPDCEKVIHVIEKSAYVVIQKQLEQERHANVELLAEIQNLRVGKNGNENHG